MPMRKAGTVIKGIPASPGFSFGEARVIFKWEHPVQERVISEIDIPDEIARLDNAVEATLVELEQWRKSAGLKIGGPVAKIFDTQMMIASDREFLRKVKDEVKKSRRNVEYIYSLEVENTITPLRLSSDPYMQQMVFDIEAVSHRIISHLGGGQDHQDAQFPPNSIIVAPELSPGEVLSLYEHHASAIVTSGGNAISHMALIARSLLLPAVVGVPRAHIRIKSGDRLVIDGEKGTIIINPPEEEWEALHRNKVKLTTQHISRLQKLPVFPPRTSDGTAVDVAANIDLPGPVDDILSKHKVSVGLYRTEFLYLQSGHFPDEDKQFEVYDAVAARYFPQSVVIRTFDLGSDKYIADQQLHESNPALGWRGIRAALDMPKIFKDQLRAILRASTHKNVKILLPMVADISELRKASSLIKRAMVELRQRKIEFDRDIEIGVMIEVPSAAVAADLLAEKVSFFSIGSNDLTQYTLAADRDNERLARIFSPLHPAVLRLIKITLEAARKRNIPVTVCGEMSGDELAIPLLIGMGISQLSMNPSKLANACNVISKVKYGDAVALADEIMRMTTLKDIESRLFEYNISL
ncbi:putative Phosphoenolpyruvate-protein phosphotransferase [Candidatus Zixiibacteriota bacterium]|nr:putative Phosphoenolpyruvate-protein phosphotransferase [candidate division Zixibacteria bacterium]